MTTEKFIEEELDKEYDYLDAAQNKEKMYDRMRQMEQLLVDAKKSMEAFDVVLNQYRGQNRHSNYFQCILDIKNFLKNE